MIFAGYLFTLTTGILLYFVPRRWAALPLLMGVAYMTRGQVLEIGPLHFPVIRILIAVGFVRVLLKGERIAGGTNHLDWLLTLWAGCLVCSSVFHTSDAWILRSGLVWTELGSYFLFRVFIGTFDDICHLFKVICVLLVPVAVAMLLEKMTGNNCFAMFGGVQVEVSLRSGHFRAQGPFAHAILAGTVGATCLPMALCLWRGDRKRALAGMCATSGMVIASGSSGPFMIALTGLAALALWKRRRYLRMFRWAAGLLIIALDLVMKDPVYYLLARIDITGGSTGWHRAALIQAAIEHMHEWWLAGTDYTRHWMPSGIYANAIHTDITNHYLMMGVYGGLPLMLLFIWVIFAAFGIVGKALLLNHNAPMERQFLIWTLGAILVAHVTNFISISYFDQSVVLLDLLLASIGALPAMKPAVTPASRASDRTEQRYVLLHRSQQSTQHPADSLPLGHVER